MAFWRELAGRALDSTATPFYLFSIEPIREALGELKGLEAALPVPVRHWLSCKTQPMRPLLGWWRRQGLGIEVVSEFEFCAALREGYPPDRILVNGPAKQRWLLGHKVSGLRVNFDSLTELRALLPTALRLNWSLGVRCHTSEEHDPEDPTWATQFGLIAEEAVAALKQLRRSGARLETIHFHLRTNVASPASYERALGEIAGICEAARFTPQYLDCGGGLPPPHVLGRDGRAFNRAFELKRLAAMYLRALKEFPGLRELWLENGRFLSARSGALVVRILEIKDNRTTRRLICDGGRTLHALISTWEEHELLTLPRRAGPARMTTVCGPTCMAFDQLARRPLPCGLRAGDKLVWLDAGAYSLPWETRFSHGQAAVLWHEEDRLDLVRKAECFEEWWSRFAPGRRLSTPTAAHSKAGRIHRR